MQTLASPPVPTPAYHRLDLRRLTWRECWRVARSPSKALLFGWAKLIGWNLAAAGGLPSPRPLTDSLLAPHELPPALAGPLAALRGECEAAGFAEPVYQGCKENLGSVDAACCLLRSGGGEILAILACARRQDGAGPAQPARCQLLSPLADGRLLSTTNSPATFQHPAGDAARLVNAPVAELLALHGRRLEAHRTRGNPPRPVQTFEEAAALHDRIERRGYDFNVARGVYVPLTAEEIAARQRLRDAKRLAAASAADAPEARQAAAVLDFLHRREGHVAAPDAGGRWLLVVSLVVFALAGALCWDAKFTALLVGALLFHETGHYLAMRAFGFRNLRMFFVPLLGAAVTGLNPRAPGWQRAVVALAGPLPGLVLGAAVFYGRRFLPTGNGLVDEAAFVTVWLNGFNLLPLLPLDGGRVLQETLFSRHPLLRTGFVALAGGGLIALGIAGLGTVLILFGLLMLGRVATTWRVGQAVRALRADDLVLTEPGPGQTVRPEAIPAVLAALRRGRHHKGMANEAVAAIDLLRSRPPGPAATAALLAAYAVAWALALGPTWPLLSAWLHRPSAPVHQVQPHATPAPDDDSDDT